MTEETAAKLSGDLILEDDIAAVIRECENTGHYTLSAESGRRYGHLKIGHLTYWAEYTGNDDGSYNLYNAYLHRMSVKDEYKQ